MAQPIPIDREQVKATYVALGSLRAAAKAHNIKETPVRQWANRDNWPTVGNAKKLIQKGESAMQEIKERRSVDVTQKSSEALSSHLENSKTEFLSHMASGLASSSRVLQEMDGMEALESSRRFVDLATAGKTIFGIGSESDAAKIQVNLLSLSADAFISKTIPA